MADFIKGLFGAASSSAASVVPGDADFADFATAPSPTAPSHAATTTGPPSVQTFGPGVPFSERPYTKWYLVNERVSPADFVLEAFILPALVAVVLAYIWGSRTNRRIARSWMASHGSVLASEFAVVGFGGGQKQPSLDDVSSQGLAKATSNAGGTVPQEALKEKSLDVFMTYATGRQNVAFADVKLNLYKRHSPVMWLSDLVLGFFFDSMPTASETAEITAYPFDGRENDLVPRLPGQEQEKKSRAGSTYDGFVWAIVHKDKMKKLRDDRYDLSLTITKDNPKLPIWATVMSESAEITDTLLTADLAKAVAGCGDDFESLIVSDMPEDAPKTLDELVPKKRLTLTTHLGPSSRGSSPATLPLLTAFLRLPDHLVNSAHFRNEVLRRVKATRDEEARKIRKLDEQGKAEERKTLSDKAKKDERDKKLKGMTADEQRKFLDKERERDQRKSMGRKSVKA